MSDQTITNEALPVNAEPSGFSHSFDTGYAVAYGVDEAIMIKNLQHFITANANRGHNLHEGRYWTYDRLDDFLKHFPYWTIQTVRRVIASLVSQEVIIKGEFNQKWSNRTQWFAFKDQEKFIKFAKPPKTPSPLPPSDLPKQATEDSQKKIADLLKSTTDSCGNQQLTDAENNNCYIDTTLSAALSTSSSLKVPEEPKEAVASEVEKKSSSKPKREKPDFSPKVREVANQMVNSLTRAKANYVPPRNLTNLLTHVDYLLRLDNRDQQLLMDVFNWALADSFWCDKMYKPNPAEYLRKQFDQLEMKMNAKPEQPKRDRRFAASSDDKAALAVMEEMNKRAL